MGKRMRRERSVCTCSRISPRPTFIAPHSSFYRYEEDVWTAITRFLDGQSLMMLGMASKWFYHLVLDESIWKFACLRDLQVPEPKETSFEWSQLYTSAFDGSHSYSFRQPEKHIDWMRIGAFSFDSTEALLSEKLITSAKIPEQESLDKMLESHGSFVLKNVKTGIWIADLQLVRCPVCDLNSCDGTMQVLDARHIELFLNKGYQDGNWDYELVGSHEIRKSADAASGSIYDIKNLQGPSTSAMFKLNSWVGKPKDWQPKAMVTFHAVAVNTNLQKNDEVSCLLQLCWGRRMKKTDQGRGIESAVAIVEQIQFHRIRRLDRYRIKILPMGSYPSIMDLSNNLYDLYGPVKLFWSTRYDKAMALYLTCLKDVADFANLKDQENNIPQEKCFKLPYKIENDKVESYSITQSFNKQENWTEALKYTLQSKVGSLLVHWEHELPAALCDGVPTL